MDSDCEGVLVISCCILPAEDIVLQILGADKLPDPQICHGTTKGFIWSIENKYYTAQANLFALKEKASLDPTLLSSIRAIIFCYNPHKQSSFEDILKWIPLLKDAEAVVQIILSNNCSEESNVPDLDKKNVLDWCIQNQFELIELNSSSDSDDEESDFKDVKGYERVIQALHSHMWSNMIMKPSEKQNQNDTSSKSSLLSVESAQKSSGGSTKFTEKISTTDTTPAKVNENGANKMAMPDEDLLREEQWLDGVLNGEDPGGESFEALFTRFASLKEKSAGLSGEERKKYAEKVAIAFWRAMGGDEDEIDGIDEED